MVRNAPGEHHSRSGQGPPLKVQSSSALDLDNEQHEKPTSVTSDSHKFTNEDMHAHPRFDNQFIKPLVQRSSPSLRETKGMPGRLRFSESQTFNQPSHSAESSVDSSPKMTPSTSSAEDFTEDEEMPALEDEAAATLAEAPHHNTRPAVNWRTDFEFPGRKKYTSKLSHSVTAPATCDYENVVFADYSDTSPAQGPRAPESMSAIKQRFNYLRQANDTIRAEVPFAHPNPNNMPAPTRTSAQESERNSLERPVHDPTTHFASHDGGLPSALEFRAGSSTATKPSMDTTLGQYSGDLWESRSICSGRQDLSINMNNWEPYGVQPERDSAAYHGPLPYNQVLAAALRANRHKYVEMLGTEHELSPEGKRGSGREFLAITDDEGLDDEYADIARSYKKDFGKEGKDGIVGNVLPRAEFLGATVFGKGSHRISLVERTDGGISYKKWRRDCLTAAHKEELREQWKYFKDEGNKYGLRDGRAPLLCERKQGYAASPDTEIEAKQAPAEKEAESRHNFSDPMGGKTSSAMRRIIMQAKAALHAEQRLREKFAVNNKQYEFQGADNASPLEEQKAPAQGMKHLSHHSTVNWPNLTHKSKVAEKMEDEARIEYNRKMGDAKARAREAARRISQTLAAGAKTDLGESGEKPDGIATARVTVEEAELLAKVAQLEKDIAQMREGEVLGKIFVKTTNAKNKRLESGVAAQAKQIAELQAILKAIGDMTTNGRGENEGVEPQPEAEGVKKPWEAVGKDKHGKLVLRENRTGYRDSGFF